MFSRFYTVGIRDGVDGLQHTCGQVSKSLFACARREKFSRISDHGSHNVTSRLPNSNNNGVACACWKRKRNFDYNFFFCFFLCLNCLILKCTSLKKIVEN
jgi:hypothetical protein